MHLRTILAIARKDAIDIIKNKQTLFALLTPIFMAIFFIFFELLFSDKGTTKIYIYDPGHSNISKVVSSMFDKVEIVKAPAAEEVTATFGADGTSKNTPYALGLIVPDNFEESVRQNQHPQVTLYIDANRTNIAQQQGVAQLITNYANNVAHPEAAVQIKQATLNPPQEQNQFDFTILSTVYTAVMIMFSLYISMFLIPAMLIEEKEKKTIRMLMVSPASFTDIIVGKVLVTLVYQIVLTSVIVAAMGGFTGNVLLLGLFIVLGAGLTLSIGLLLGCIFKTTAAAGSIGGGLGGVLLTIPGMLAGPFGAIILGDSGVSQALKVMPTYYIADGLYMALLNQNKPVTVLLDAAVLVGSAAIVFMLAVWALRRQATVVAGI